MFFTVLTNIIWQFLTKTLLLQSELNKNRTNMKKNLFKLAALAAVFCLNVNNVNAQAVTNGVGTEQVDPAVLQAQKKAEAAAAKQLKEQKKAEKEAKAQAKKTEKKRKEAEKRQALEQSAKKAQQDAVKAQENADKALAKYEEGKAAGLDQAKLLKLEKKKVTTQQKVVKAQAKAEKLAKKL